jgi:hypothetical protein
MPAHGDGAGRVILEQAYAIGKMLDNSGWNGLLRDKITPSDIDHPAIPLCFDNNGAVIFADLSINCDDWSRALRGQRRLYESIIRNSPHCAVICRHNVPPEIGRQIDTLRDVDRFQVMVWDDGPVLSPTYDGAYWQGFVTTWVNEPNGPQRIRRAFLGLSVGLVKPKPRTVPP